jgi:eukaryotic-like serine/threonine-protein kinase
MQELASGTWITPSVRLVRPLDAGGMSTVWVAADMRLQTQVAVKILSRQLLSDEGARTRFEREGRLPSQIGSPHLVQTYDHGFLPDGTPFIVMEWLDGETLKHRLVREQRIAPRHTLSVVEQICRCLERAHAAGVVHRDIKPDNVFLLRHEREMLVKILDFGVAKKLGEDTMGALTRRDETLGTPGYMSPEQLRNAAAVDHRADLWSVAVLTYRMLVGALPFVGPDFPAMCLTIIQGSYEPPSSYDRSWPPALDAWFARSLSVQREARHPSALELAAGLAHAIAPLADAEPAGAPPQVAARSIRWETYQEHQTMPRSGV